MENDSLFAGQEKLDAEEDFVMKDDTRRLSPRRVVAGEHRCGSQLVSWPQSNSSERCCNNLCGDLSETNSKLCQPNFHHVGNQSSEQSGLKSIVLAYFSSDESDEEIEDENENTDEMRSDSDCSTNNKLDWLSLKNANGAKTFESFFTNKSCSGFSSNQPVCAPDCNVLNNGYPGHDSSFPSGTKVLLSSDKDTEVCGNSYENHDGSFGNPTGRDSSFPSSTKVLLSSDKDREVGCEILDQVMTMLIRLRMSVVRLSSSGHFPYSAAPLITLMGRVEKCYDGC
ncbi:hypothetical protein OS493_006013 [Desmophyllum pertusum]|uniref:Uncharacterized protein n=1 Tax=Desmophyllum pertusum TaxID=174260 RepID=A0A9X0CII1_9CNID|nr:hypothetical protein OS493_006013 [Desmophyllum pertusum]